MFCSTLFTCKKSSFCAVYSVYTICKLKWNDIDVYDIRIAFYVELNKYN